ncbi:hypothetical protein LEP1GSC058_1613 [Leptospira fainei serovar Hurstbridge str. BUT 6]|uniref:Uncharacterized protein n=1 Tax=Leptospira fainei serovar Hurstbridge str. BUT 6 TaxID=1193011 RepID=S3W404_9LEPT|nr:hypothetical protein LEP1GSC058_1613 [Leptospira fainei serovar Hurstbridge str. BUT 6]
MSKAKQFTSFSRHSLLQTAGASWQYSRNRIDTVNANQRILIEYDPFYVLWLNRVR